MNSKLVNGNFNSRVVKSSRLLTKIASYLVSISWLLCLAFLYEWHFLNKISQDWLLTLTTQPSTSKLSDNPVKSSFLEITFLSFWQTSGNSYSSLLLFIHVVPFHSLTHPSSPDEAKMVPVTFHSTLQTWNKNHLGHCDGTKVQGASDIFAGNNKLLKNIPY